ncbi:hypothetical protein [Yersinia intermedia]|uniref:hypothetical protein n=1 Tax=Yersinia intermedia TaxID=631 RepID=UPI0014822FDF|nr:hypothetical protein [Yersinia intermedia]
MSPATPTFASNALGPATTRTVVSGQADIVGDNRPDSLGKREQYHRHLLGD